jgi:hypothetical protein
MKMVVSVLDNGRPLKLAKSPGVAVIFIEGYIALLGRCQK